MEENIYQINKIVKSNEMVSSKYSSTLLENLVMSVALSRIEASYKGGAMELQAKLYPRELSKLFKVSDQSHIYRDLKKLSKRITGHTMFLEDGKGNFQAFAAVPNAAYEDGIFTITFNRVLSNHIFGLKDGFSTMELSILTEFERNSSFRLYELLKKEVFKIGSSGYYDVEYRISEFKFIIGLADIDLVKNEISTMGNNIDWDLLYNKLDKKNRKYEDYKDLVKRVLNPAKEELEQVSDIKFEYVPIREGHAYKKIQFRIYKNTPSEEVIKKSEKIFDSSDGEQLKFPKDIETYKPLYEKFIGHNDLTSADIDILLKDSGWDIEKVEEAILLADEQKYLKNYVGWIRSCIKKNYSKPIEVLDGSHEDAVIVNNIKEEVENNKEDIATKVWAKTKQSDLFPEFEAYIETQGVTIEQLETLYSCAELNQAFVDYRFGRPMSIF